MPSLQELLEIALRYATAMSDAMVLAVYRIACKLGVRLARPSWPRERTSARVERGERPEDGADWRRLVETNADTRLNHV